MAETYLFKINYYDKFEEKDVCCYGTVAGDNYADVMRKIEQRFDGTSCFLDDVFIRETFANSGFTFLDEDVWKKIYEEDEAEYGEGDDNDVRSI